MKWRLAFVAWVLGSLLWLQSGVAQFNGCPAGFCSPSRVGGGAATATWNPADKNASITLSNGNLTATTSAGAYTSVRATTSALSGQKYYELTLNTNPGGELIIFGICNAIMSLNDFVGHENNGIGYDPAASIIWLNGTTTSIQSGTTNDIISIAVDIGNTSFWARTNAGNWNNSGTANPATNTGGKSFSTMAAGPYFPCLALNTNGTQATGNFGGSSYAESVPSGFGNW